MLKKILTVWMMIFIFCVGINCYAVNNTGTTIIYVSKQGNDDWAGTKDKPIATPEEAINRVNRLSHRPVKVIFDEGEYYIDKAMTIKASGLVTSPIEITARDGAKVVFTGAKRIDTSKFEPITDESIIKRLDKDAKEHIVKVELSEQGFESFGVPNASNWLDMDLEYAWVSLFLNEKEQMESQWPNGDYNYTEFDRCVYGGTAKSKTDAAVFKYKGSRPTRWTEAKHAWVGTYPNEVYLYSRAMIKNIDTMQQTISTSHSFSSNMGDKVKIYKVFNLLEEIDRPTEWYLDPETLTLYYYPEEEFEETDVLEISTLCDDMIKVFGDNIKISNICFEKNRGDFIAIAGESKNTSIDNCQFLYGKNAAIRTSTEIGRFDISNNYFAHLDGNALYLHGSSKKSGDRKSTIKNNYITDVGKQLQNMGHAVANWHSGIVAENNTVANTIAGAWFQISDSLTLKNNEFYHFSQQFGDQGAFYAGQNLGP